MNVNVQKLMDAAGMQRERMKPGINFTASDKLSFDSLINNMKSKQSRPSNKSEEIIKRNDNYRFEQAERKLDKQSNHKAINDNEYKSGPEHSERQDRIDDLQYNRRKDAEDRAAEKSGRDAAEVRNAGNTPNASASEVRQVEGSLEDNTNEADLTKEVLFYDMLNSQSEALISDSPVDGSSISVNQETLQTSNNQEEENNLNIDAIVNGLIQIHTDEMTDNSLLSKAVQTTLSEMQAEQSGEGKGLKTNQLLSEIIKASLPVSKDTKDGDALTTNNTETIKSGLAGAEKGFKIDEALFETTDKSIEKVKTYSNNNLNIAQTKMDSPAAELETLIEASSKKADKNNDNKHAQIKELRSKVETSELPAQANANQKELTSKLMPDYAATAIREAGLNNNTNSLVKPLSSDSESVKAMPVGNSSVSHEGSKVSEGLLTGKLIKPSAFNEVANKIIYTIKGSSKLGVTVQNESLGKLDIKLSLEKGMVSVHINTADKVVKEYVESNIQQIVDSLSKSGVSVGGFSVGLKNNKNSEGYENGNGKGYGNERVFSIDKVLEKDYLKAIPNAQHNSGLVNVFA